MKKNPHAVALGRKGGKARTAALSASERRRIARLGGRPPLYRIHVGELQKRIGESWCALEAPFDEAAKAFLRRHRS